MATALPAPTIGIDLGTTFSCVAVLNNGKVEIIKNQHGKTTMPSYVAYTESGRLVGERAKQWALIDPENTINNMKRLIGRKVNDEHVKEDIQMFPFDVVNDDEGNLKVQVKYEGQDKLFRLEEISAAVLWELKTSAEEYLHCTVKDAVITVPAYFTNAQRQATIDAGTIAGLNVLGTINEPTAAALAYGFDKTENEQKNVILIYDFGGGTFDVSLLNVVNGQIDTLATGGNGHLGGEDIDNILVNHFSSEFLSKHKIDLVKRAKSSDPEESRNAVKALRRLRFACEKAKIQLSTDRNARIELDLLFNGMDLYTKISRGYFEVLCGNLIRNTLQTVVETIERANLTPDEISEVILVGGSTRIPMVTNMLKEMFPKKEVCGTINPDEAVAYGAAIQSAILSGVDPLLVRNVQLRDVTPMSLGIETSGGIMANIIKRNTPVPVRKTRMFTTNRDNQTEIHFKVCEGERHLTKHNNLLGEFTLFGILPAPRRVPQIEVSFDVDANGILQVRVTDLGTEWKSGIDITNNQSRMNKLEIEKAIKEAEEMRPQDLLYRKKVEAREQLEVYAKKIEKSLKNPRIRERISPEELSNIFEKVDECLRLYESYLDPSEEDFESKRSELEKLWFPVVRICYPDETHRNPDAPVLQNEDSFYERSSFEFVERSSDA